MGHVGSKSCHAREEGADRHSQFREHKGEASTPQHRNVDRRLEKTLEYLVVCPVEIVKVAAHRARRGTSRRDVARVILSELRVLRRPRALQKVGVHDAVAHRQGSGSAARTGSAAARVRDCAACLRSIHDVRDALNLLVPGDLAADLRVPPPPAAEPIRTSILITLYCYRRTRVHVLYIDLVQY